MFNKIKQVWKNTVLCIKYPFLYTRNRYSDEHYRNLWIHNKLWNIRKEYFLNFSINIFTPEQYQKKLEAIKNESYASTVIDKCIDIHGTIVSLTQDVTMFSLSVDNNYTYSYNIDEYLGKKGLTHKDVADILLVCRTTTTLMGETIYKPNIFILLKDSAPDERYWTFNCVNFYTKPIKKYEVKLLELTNDFLKLFHILPSSIELDAMEPGWRIKFGEDICKEIKKSILTTYIKNEQPTSLFGKIKCYCKGIRHLYSYRIQQIKEKFGQLRWYAYGDTEDTLKIISKYEDISERTCIICGKEATYRSTGWVCPFCEEHKPQNSIKIETNSN